MKKHLEDIDRKLFNFLVNLSHIMIDRGYVQAWFSWLEWIGLTSVLFIAAKKAQSGLLYFTAGFSCVMLLFVGFAGVEKFVTKEFSDSKNKTSLIFIFYIAVNVFGAAIVWSILFELLPVLLRV